MEEDERDKLINNLEEMKGRSSSNKPGVKMEIEDAISKLQEEGKKENKESKNKTKDKEKSMTIGDYKKIENILDNDRLIKIYPLLPGKESKKEFMEILSEKYGDKLNEKFWDRLDEEFEDTEIQTLQGYFKENKRNQKTIMGIARSRRREALRQGVNERVDELKIAIDEGRYITKEDMKFLEKHAPEMAELARQERHLYFSERKHDNNYRERIHVLKLEDERLQLEIEKAIGNLTSDLGSYDGMTGISGPNIGGKSEAYYYNQISRTSQKALDEDIQKNQSIIQYRKQKIEELKEQQRMIRKEIKYYEEMIENKGVIIHSREEHLHSDLERTQNSQKLGKLYNELEEENIELASKGIKLPETGIREEDNIEIATEENSNREIEKKENKELTEEEIKEANELYGNILKWDKQNVAQQEVRQGRIDSQNKGELPQEKVGKIKPEEIESIVAINPEVLQIIAETAATKQMVRASEKEQSIEEQR